MQGSSGSFRISSSLALEWAAGTDIGLSRSDNQDSYLAAPPLFLVADGMGGHAGGAQASRTLLAGLQPLEGTKLNKEKFLSHLNAACLNVISLAKKNENYAKYPPGTTLTGLVFLSPPDSPAEPTVEVLNVGDSRSYLLENGLLTQLTRDHSEVAQLVEQGILTKAQARLWPNRCVITRAVGAGLVSPPEFDYWSRPVQTGQRFLICSDGLHSLLDDGEIGVRLENNANKPRPEQAVQSLIDAALRRGGGDNITVIVLDIVPVKAGADSGVPSNEPY